MGISRSRPFQEHGVKEIRSIQDLPDDIILSLMSQLSPRDVLNFSMVSKQWNHIPYCVDKIVIRFGTDDEGFFRCSAPADAFVKGVNLFLQCYRKHQNMSSMPLPLHSFHICFCLDKTYSADIDSWISFAVHKGVTSLDLFFKCELHQEFDPDRPDDEKYIFPWHILEASPSPIVLQSIKLSSCIFACRLTSVVWTALQVLDLCLTEITNDDLDSFIRCFPNLQKIVLLYCHVPRKLTFDCSSLTCLSIKYCIGNLEVEVLNGNALVEFCYKGKRAGLNQINAPNLTHCTFGTISALADQYVFQNLCQDFPYMRSLSIFRDSETALPPVSHYYGQMSSFLYLDELRLYNFPECEFSLQTMAEVLKASPNLKRLEMIPPCTVDAGNDNIDPSIKLLHKNLAFVKISGFCGSKGKVELAKFLVQVTEALHHVVLEKKAEVSGYMYSEHYGNWHGEENPADIKDTLLNLMKRGELTFC